ncbi:hypothetical protein P8452_43073 [Trifolium repens]|nr:hypothetical protein P8452_43073 [Trifolium repens]
MGAVCGCLRGPPQSPQNNGSHHHHQHQHHQETRNINTSFVYSYRHSETTQYPFSKNPTTNSELVTSIKAKSVESSFKYFACESESWHENSCVICFEEYTDHNPRITTECCRQHYHLTCIYEWKNRSETCPTCRQEMIFKEMA